MRELLCVMLFKILELIGLLECELQSLPGNVLENRNVEVVYKFRRGSPSSPSPESGLPHHFAESYFSIYEAFYVVTLKLFDEGAC